ncbi:hypothetical protein ACFL54_06790 [Planctomycetota bacterium]
MNRIIYRMLFFFLVFGMVCVVSGVQAKDDDNAAEKEKKSELKKLKKAYRNDNPNERMAVVSAAIELDFPDACKWLDAVAGNDPHPCVCIFALSYRQILEDKKIISQLLCYATSYPSPLVRIQAGRLLRRVALEKRQPIIDGLYKFILHGKQSKGITILQNENRSTRGAEMERMAGGVLLGNLIWPEAEAALLKCLEAKDLTVCRAGALGYSYLWSNQHEGAMIRLFERVKDVDIRAEILVSLINNPSLKAVAFLKKARCGERVLKRIIQRGIPIAEKNLVMIEKHSTQKDENYDNVVIDYDTLKRERHYFNWDDEIHICINTTTSMANNNRLQKAKNHAIGLLPGANASSLTRYSVVFLRDHNNQYTTKEFILTVDYAKMAAFIQGAIATGADGSDTPMDQALKIIAKMPMDPYSPAIRQVHMYNDERTDKNTNKQNDKKLHALARRLRNIDGFRINTYVMMNKKRIVSALKALAEAGGGQMQILSD